MFARSPADVRVSKPPHFGERCDHWWHGGERLSPVRGEASVAAFAILSWCERVIDGRGEVHAIRRACDQECCRLSTCRDCWWVRSARSGIILEVSHSCYADARKAKLTRRLRARQCRRSTFEWVNELGSAALPDIRLDAGMRVVSRLRLIRKQYPGCAAMQSTELGGEPVVSLRLVRVTARANP